MEEPDETNEQGAAHVNLVPLWLHTPDPTRYPFQPLSSEPLWYRLNIFQDWGDTPVVEELPTHTEHIYRGASAGDWLCIAFMKNAVPGHDMRNWVMGTISMVGFPAVQMTAIQPEPKLLVWKYTGSCQPYQANLGVDEMHTYE
jgi:hypothetical protein